MMSERGIRFILILLLFGILVLLYIFFFLTPRGKGGIKTEGRVEKEGVEFLFAVLGPGKGDKPYFWRPLGAASDEAGNLYVSDTNNHRVCVFDHFGNFLFEFGKYGVEYPTISGKSTWKGGEFNRPYGLDISDEGKIYVADMLNGRVQVFDKRGKFLFYFPERKSLDPRNPFHSQVLRPRDLAVENGKVYVCDSFRIAVFDLEGNFLYSLGSGKIGPRPGDLNAPNGVVVAQDGTVYVSDSNNFRVQAFSPNGKVKWVLGGPKSSLKIGVPRGITLDKKGNVIVIDALRSKILVISSQGKLLKELGSRGSEEAEFNFPNDMVVRPDGVIYVADKDNNRIQAIKLHY
jgi:DNA-binding beta-propeller fold protein YncE